MEISNEAFDAFLQEILDREGHKLLSIPGIYEIVSEEFNNEILDRWDGGDNNPVG